MNEMDLNGYGSGGSSPEKKTNKDKELLKRVYIFVALFSALILGKTVIFPLIRVEKANGLLASGKYGEASSVLNEIENNDVIDYVKYHHAVSYIRSGKNDEAILLLSDLTYKDSKELYTQCCNEQYGTKKTQYLESILVGNLYAFGEYEQDNNTENGKETILWIVLDKEGTRLLLISKYVLDCQPYHTANEDVTWETCSLRKWLNEDFLNNAFNEGQKECICTTFHVADQVRANSTNDKVFILNPAEVNKYYGLSDHYITREARQCQLRQCQLTEYARAQGAKGVNSVGRHEGPYCGWWLRAPADQSRGNTAVISSSGHYCPKTRAQGDGTGVRPVVWIDLGKE